MRVSQSIREELHAHALEEAPNECCGVIVFRDDVAERYVRGRNLIGKPATTRTFQQHIRCKLKAAEVREMVTQLIQSGHLQQEADGTLVMVAKPAED